MFKISLQDLVVRLDEQRGVLQLLVPKNGGKLGELRIFHEISEDDAFGEDSLESHLGTTIVAFLSATYSSKQFHMEQYRKAGDAFDKIMLDDAALLLDSGDADNEFEGAMLRIHRFDETWSLEDIDGITALLARTAKCGSKKAEEFLHHDWPMRSKLMKKRLERAQGGQGRE